MTEWREYAEERDGHRRVERRELPPRPRLRLPERGEGEHAQRHGRGGQAPAPEQHKGGEQLDGRESKQDRVMTRESVDGILDRDVGREEQRGQDGPQQHRHATGCDDQACRGSEANRSERPAGIRAGQLERFLRKAHGDQQGSECEPPERHALQRVSGGARFPVRSEDAVAAVAPGNGRRERACREEGGGRDPAIAVKVRIGQDERRQHSRGGQQPCAVRKPRTPVLPKRPADKQQRRNDQRRGAEPLRRQLRRPNSGEAGRHG